MDGLADTADGFFSVRSRDEMLAIMRDSRTGAMGVIAVVIVISLKIAFLASVPPCLRWGQTVLMPLAGRSGSRNSHGRPFLRQEGSRTGVGIQRKSRTILRLVEYGCSARYQLGRLPLARTSCRSNFSSFGSLFCSLYTQKNRRVYGRYAWSRLRARRDRAGSGWLHPMKNT